VADAPDHGRGLRGPGDAADDRALLAAHVAGDPDAFATLVRRHQDRLWAVALRTTGNREDAADALQEALVAAYRRAGSYRGDAAVTTWLHRVVVNACLDRLRATSRRRADPLPEDLAERTHRGTAADVSRPGHHHDGDPATAVVATEERRQVLAALQRLPAPQRAAIVLVDLEGLGVAEAAEVLGCAPGTVKSRCSRGRATLAGLLRALLQTDEGRDRSAPPAGNRPVPGAVTSSTPPRGPPPAT